jgi:hypothetical protein
VDSAWGGADTRKGLSERMTRRRTISLITLLVTAAVSGGWHAHATAVGAADVPAVSIADTSATEGDKASITITLSSACSSGYVEVVVDTQNFTTGQTSGSAVQNADYPRFHGHVVFLQGVTSRTILMNTIEDSERESTETYSLFLGPPGGTCQATIGDGEAVSRILDDDGGSGGGGSGPSAADVNDAKVKEGNSGTRSCLLPVTLDPPSDHRVTVHWATQDGTATAGSDYQAGQGTVDFPGGSDTATIAVPVIGDRINEPGRTEQFSVTLDNPTGGASLGRSVASCSIKEGKRG